ncbi:MAG: ABC transporter ATP-binding protein, partial [Clostridia bacterium]|nr:ABC transporter ATP-binding protein [Clostridia bacterium]
VLLILDEATAAMDTRTEQIIQRSLTALSKGRTTLIIAHRLSTLRDADELIVIDKKTVAERGTPEELLKSKGIYYSLYKLQTEALKTIGISED